MAFDLTGFFFLLASDEGALHDDAVSTCRWSSVSADYRTWLVRLN